MGYQRDFVIIIAEILQSSFKPKNHSVFRQRFCNEQRNSILFLVSPKIGFKRLLYNKFWIGFFENRREIKNKIELDLAA